MYNVHTLVSWPADCEDLVFVHSYRVLKVFHAFIGAIKTVWGRDEPEDVMGGLNTALSRLSWRSNSSKVS